MSIHNTSRRLSRRRRRYVATWILAGPVMIGSAATAQDTNISQVVPQQNEVFPHLGKLYERIVGERSSIRVDEARNSDIPWGMTTLALEDASTRSNVASGVRTVAAEEEEESRRGVFSFFRREDSAATSRASERPNFFGRVRNRMMRPFRDEEPEKPTPESESEIADETRRPNFSPPQPPASTSTITPPPAPSVPPPAPRTARADQRSPRGMFPIEESDQPNLVPLPPDDLGPQRRTFTRESDAASDPSRIKVPAAQKSFPPPPPAATPEPIRTDRFADAGTSATAIRADEPIRDSRYVALTRKLAEREGLVGMQGYCPVALREQERLVDSRPEFLCVYHGRTYRVSSAEAKARFDAHPARYAPAAKGFDVVLESRGERGVDGVLANAIWYQDQLYLFRTPETAREFKADPERYVRE